MITVTKLAHYRDSWTDRQDGVSWTGLSLLGLQGPEAPAVGLLEDPPHLRSH